MDAAFEDFVLARGEALLRFALMLCADRGRSEDLVQSVLARAYPRWTRILVMDRPEAYLKTMLVNEHLRQRAVLVLRYYEDLSDAEIATILNCTQATVRSQAARALATLRTAVPHLDPEALP